MIMMYDLLYHTCSAKVDQIIWHTFNLNTQDAAKKKIQEYSGNFDCILNLVLACSMWNSVSKKDNVTIK